MTIRIYNLFSEILIFLALFTKKIRSYNNCVFLNYLRQLLNNRHKISRHQGSTTNQTTVYILIGKQFSRISRFRTASI